MKSYSCKGKENEGALKAGTCMFLEIVHAEQTLWESI